MIKRKANELTIIVLMSVDLSSWILVFFLNKRYALDYSLIPMLIVTVQIMSKVFLGALIYNLYREAYADMLTGLHSRRYFYKRVYNNKIKPPFSMLLIDIDSFKSVNDNYGHLMGDFVLREFADILRRKARKNDIIARWGGEEFVMALPQTGVDEAFHIADAIRKAVERHCFCCEGVTCSITVSIGIASIDGRTNVDDIEQFFVAADKALYKAKENKNHITVTKI
jgi:diguanylate cyclase (GGDEF)-like protein